MARSPTFSAGSGQAAKARFDAANASGGVNGRQFDYADPQNDQGDVSKSLAGGKQLVQQDGVFAVVPVDHAATQRVPSSSSSSRTSRSSAGGSTRGFCDSHTYGFGFTGCLVPPPPVTTAGTPGVSWSTSSFKEHGETSAKGKTAAVIAEDNDSGKSGVAGHRRLGRSPPG